MQDTELTTLQSSILTAVAAVLPRSANLLQLWGTLGRPDLEDFILALVELEKDHGYLLAGFFDTQLSNAGRDYLAGKPTPGSSKRQRRCSIDDAFQLIQAVRFTHNPGLSGISVLGHVEMYLINESTRAMSGTGDFAASV